MIDDDLVRAFNEAHPRLELAAAREAELAVELNQLKRAIDHVAHPPSFHAEPADFRVALLAQAADRT